MIGISANNTTVGTTMDNLGISAVAERRRQGFIYKRTA